MRKNKPKILLVEDDTNLGFVLNDYLSMSHYETTLAKDGNQGLESFKSGNYDLCILDVMLPFKDGFTLAQEIRKLEPNVPIIFLTAKNMEKDKVRGFRAGGDDYITKPFSTEELSLRIEAILRRSKYSILNNDFSTEFEIGKYRFNYTNHTLGSQSGERRLTKKEAEVLRLLCLNKNQIVKREVALKNIWGDDDYFMGRSMDVYITKLRKFLNEDENVSIVNIPRTGFKLEIKE
ncbi:MAG: response regulator transcription factor [Bacteroidales bacterium]|nr:response regulator transcription factor [Bacteroidales bacterium]